VSGVAAEAGVFGDRLDGAVRTRGSQLVLGLDPHPLRLWPAAVEQAGGDDHASLPPAVRAAHAVATHCRLVIEAVGTHCVAVKPQIACFERLGAPGWEALAECISTARAAGLLVIADAKRGDFPVSAAAYAQAFLGHTETPFGTVPGLGADALTVNPLLGADSLEPFVSTAREGGAGLFVLARTSNPGAADFQDREMADSRTLSAQIASVVEELGQPGRGLSGLSDVGAVVGATAPHRLEALRALMPHTVFLMPGVGAQGGAIADLAAAYAPGVAGGLPSASRSIVDAYLTAGGEPAAAAAAEAARLREAAWDLSH
jgi:orotidine-5'-phosphate decarboxylase